MARTVTGDSAGRADACTVALFTNISLNRHSKAPLAMSFWEAGMSCSSDQSMAKGLLTCNSSNEE